MRDQHGVDGAGVDVEARQRHESGHAAVDQVTPAGALNQKAGLKPSTAGERTSSAQKLHAHGAPRSRLFGRHHSLASVASPACLRSAATRRLCDLRRVLLGVLSYPPGEKLDRHDAERRMPTLARPVSVGQCLEQPCELPVLSDDRV